METGTSIEDNIEDEERMRRNIDQTTIISTAITEFIEDILDEDDALAVLESDTVNGIADDIVWQLEHRGYKIVKVN